MAHYQTRYKNLFHLKNLGLEFFLSGFSTNEPQAWINEKVAPMNNLHEKRTEYLSWEDYFMSVACLSAMRSKDPSTQVGACIVNTENKIVGIGYNGMPTGCSDNVLPWKRTGDAPLETKYPYVCHAEMNAVMNTNSHTKECTIYSSLFPCNECAKLIIQAGIKNVVYLHDKYPTSNGTKAAKHMFDIVGVNYRRFETRLPSVLIEFPGEVESSTDE